jgi:hypothetical protein
LDKQKKIRRRRKNLRKEQQNMKQKMELKCKKVVNKESKKIFNIFYVITVILFLWPSKDITSCRIVMLICFFLSTFPCSFTKCGHTMDHKPNQPLFRHVDIVRKFCTTYELFIVSVLN